MVSEKLEPIDDYRYERKFLVTNLTAQQVEGIVRTHPAMFSEIYPQRYVNNIYFDGIDSRSYLDNVHGNVRRTKVRIRWYGELFGTIEKPTLELKVKNGLVGRKESFPLRPLKVESGFDGQTASQVIEKSGVPDAIKIRLKCLYPTLLNRYRRKYFRSVDKTYRLTLDTNQVLYRISNHNNLFLNKWVDNLNVIVELKYDRHMDENSHAIASFFPFRMAKYSKFVTAFERLYGW
jgi:hypothetical protein